MQTSFEDFTVDAVCTTLSFVLSVKTPGPPRRARGLPYFLYDNYYAYECVISLFRLAAGSTSRPGGSPPCTMWGFLQSDK